MNKAISILSLILVFAFASCSKILDIVDGADKESDPVLVSMEYDGIRIKEELPKRTKSQFYLRKHSFSYFISTHFSEGAMMLRLLVSSEEGFELDRWYNLPTVETEQVWESFAEIEYDRAFWDEGSRKATSGKVKFTNFKQDGKVSAFGEGYCTIEGEFEITLEKLHLSESAIEITKGKFSVPKSNYWDSRAMED